MIVNHQIKSQVFDTSFLGDQSEAHALYTKLKSLHYDVVLKVIEDCFDQFDQEENSLVIDFMELDLGKISCQDIETEMPMLIKEVLIEKLTDIFVHKRGAFALKRITRETEKVVLGFLDNGFVETTNSRIVDESLKECIASGEIVNILKKIRRNKQARSRVFRRVSKEEIIRIIQFCAPDNFNYINTFYSHVTKGKSPVYKNGQAVGDQSLQLLHVIFEYMISMGDSHFNAREFTKSIINTIALKYNISFAVLIGYLRQNITSTSEAYKNKRHQILNEISSSLDVRKQNLAEINKFDKYNNSEKFFDSLDTISFQELLKKTDVKTISHVIFRSGNRFLNEVENLKDRAGFFDVFVKTYNRTIVNQVIGILESGGAESIYSIHNNLFDFQDASHFVSDSSGSFQRNIMKLSMMILIVDRGSRFNQKVFVTNLVKRTAANYSVSYQELLAGLKKACDHWEKFMTNTGQFVSLIDELYYEVIGKEFQLHKKDSYFNENKIDSLDKVDLFKVLNNKSLYDSISTWRLQYLLSDFFRSDISQDSWVALWNSLGKLNSLYKFFIAASVTQFHVMIEKINADDNIVSAHELITKTITRLFSPSHKSYLVTLDVKLFELLLQNRIKTINQSDLLTLLLKNIIPSIPVSADVFLSHLKSERLPMELKNFFDSNYYKIAEPNIDSVSGDYNSDILLLIRKRKHDFSVIGYDGIVQFVDHASQVDRSLLISLFEQLDKTDMKFVIDSGNSEYLSRLVQLYEPEYDYDFSNYLRLSAEKMTRELIPGKEKILRSFKEIIILSIYKKSDFRIKNIVNKLYGAIKNNNADCLFELPTMSLPLYGNINSNIDALETKVTENSMLMEDKENEDKEVLKKLIKLEKEVPHESLEDPLFIHNAGLVLLHPYLGHLFDRVGFFEAGNFKSKKARKEAAIYLNYILLNDIKYKEENLTLNKILCGLNVDEIIDFDLELTLEMEETASGMLDAFIGHWTKISNSTHDGVRGGWFWREGKLIIDEDTFELTVEQKAYDILMDQLPFTLSPVICSWMKKPLNIIWR